MKQNLIKFGKNVRAGLAKHSPAILTGLGIAGMVTSVVMAVKATPKALTLIEDRELELGVDKLTPVDTVKTAWKCYIPAAASVCLSSACLIGACSVNTKRNAALATAYSISETALKEYQAKVVETIGEKKERAIKDSIAKDAVEKNPIVNNEVIITDKGRTLCYDKMSGRYFESDIDKLRKAEIELNLRMLDEMYVSLNDFYYEIGLSGTTLGDMIGWNISHGKLELYFSSQIADDGRPCIVLDYRVGPYDGFTNF